ncbi:PREDICTED: cellular retinoic acid-binding protein 2-like [Priapulus caudatus]|uniref:Cellular retinoic acid-binding protein 2-like n=1 Tax=Priapulus caudatus TaxID=37621 RepID=A0ABM1DQD0_PRICU|nr:PREDICTED: cellular retinoic acid-binding protein 2-like [Priapulus caudatus]
MEQFTGKWKQERAENLDEYLTARGVPWIARKAATVSSLHMEVEGKPDDTWRLYQYTTLRTIMDVTFTPGKEFDFKRMDGIECKVTFRVDGMKLLQDTREADGSIDVIKRELMADGSLVQTLSCKDVVCKRYFTKV